MSNDLNTTDTAVRTSVDVQAPIEHAFRVFTEGIQTWWNPDHHIIDVARMVFEPRVGGRIIDVGKDGSECAWGRVLAYDPPNLVRFSWDINVQWQIETDPAKTSEVEVVFTADGPDRTHVQLTHSNLERHGEGWEGMRDAVGSGWDLSEFAKAAAG